jgi:hypothetical protein
MGRAITPSLSPTPEGGQPRTALRRGKGAKSTARRLRAIAGQEYNPGAEVGRSHLVGQQWLLVHIMSQSTSGSSGTPAIVVDPGSTGGFFKAYESSDPRFQITGRIDSYSDNLSFTIVTRILSTAEKCAIPNAAEAFFDAMMAHFQNSGGLPAALRGIWDSSDPELTTNLTRFNDAILAGDDELTAAGKTFTGRMAKKYHYDLISFGLKEPPNAIPGHYSRVHAYFRK